MKRLQYCSAFLLACSANLFCLDIYEYRIEQNSLIFNGDSSQGAYFTPPFQEPEYTSYLLATSKHQIPEVKLSEAPDWVQLNDIAWETFYDHIRPSSTFEFNGKTIQARPSSQYSDNEYFWDQCLIKAGFARYAHRDINTRGGLDSFYSVQHMDGYIPREILSDGREHRLFPGQTLHLKLDHPPVPSAEPINVLRGFNTLYNLSARLFHHTYYRAQHTQAERQIRPLIEVYTEENKNNPPLAAHAEWQDYLLSRNKTRLKSVLKALRAQTHWLEHQRQIKGGPLDGLFWQRTLASGMDNLPDEFRHWENFQKKTATMDNPDYIAQSLLKYDASFDISAQMKLQYDALAHIETHLGNPGRAKIWTLKSEVLTSAIRECMWDEENSFFFNVSGTCENKDRTYSLSGYWALYASIATIRQAHRMLRFLTDSSKFNTHMPFATLAADHPEFSKEGNYWKGGVWPPMNYIAIKGLMKYALFIPEAWDIAVKATNRYINLLSATMSGSLLLSNGNDIENNFASRIYEYNNPTTGGRGTTPVAQGNFVGWGGLGPIALMQEVAIGIEVQEREITWYVNRDDNHGISHLNIGEASIDLELEQRAGRIKPEDLSVTISGKLTHTGVRRIKVIDKRSLSNSFTYYIRDEVPEQK